MELVTYTLQSKGNSDAKSEFFKIYTKLSPKIKKVKTSEQQKYLDEIVSSMKKLQSSLEGKQDGNGKS
jgi:hypothetical protein